MQPKKITCVVLCLIFAVLTSRAQERLGSCILADCAL